MHHGMHHVLQAASYEFTTLTCIPGIIHYKDCKIQLLDLPGIIEGASYCLVLTTYNLLPGSSKARPTSHYSLLTAYCLLLALY